MADGFLEVGLGIEKHWLMRGDNLIVNVDKQDYLLDCKEAVNFIKKYRAFEDRGTARLGYVSKSLFKKIEEDVIENEEPEIDRCNDILERLKNMHLSAIGRGSEIKEPPVDIEKKKKNKKSKYLSPEYMIIFDDLSNELKSRTLTSLLKFNRHFKAKLIISSQWLHDLLPESRKQIDLFLIFKGFPQDKIALIYKDCDSSIPFETFYHIYKKSTKKPHSFMYIDTRSDEFRCNFDKKFIIQSKDDD